MSAQDNILSLHAGISGPAASRSVPLGASRSARVRRASVASPSAGPRPVASGSRRERASSRREPDPIARRSHGRPAHGSRRAGCAPCGAASFAGAHSVLIAIVLAVAFVAAVLYAPLRQIYVARRANAVLAARLDEATATSSELQAEVDALMTREGVEDQARRLGYVYEGESAVDMAGVSDDESSGDDSQQDERLPWYTRALDFVFGYQPDGKAAK